MVLGEDFGKVPAEADDHEPPEPFLERFDVLGWVMARYDLDDVDGDRTLADPLGHWEQRR